MDLVCDLKAELFTICESWLHDLDSAILGDLTLPCYSKLYHCPRADRRGGGTALLYRDGLDVNKVFQASGLRLKCRNGLWCSDLFVCVLSSCIGQHTLRSIP